MWKWENRISKEDLSRGDSKRVVKIWMSGIQGEELYIWSFCKATRLDDITKEMFVDIKWKLQNWCILLKLRGLEEDEEPGKQFKKRMSIS